MRRRDQTGGLDDATRQAVLNDRLAEARAALSGTTFGTVPYKNALSAIRQLERIIMTAEDLAPTVDPHRSRRVP